MPFASAAPGDAALRAEVRKFITDEYDADPTLRGRGFDWGFSARLAERGWVGMVIPADYGGAGRSPVDQLIVAEELLAAHAPIGAHHAAERQTAPMLLRFGTELQKRRFLPEIASGKTGFALGMSEPDSGSDLASVRCKAVETDDGWLLNGTKVWTSWADRVQYAVVLCRTSPAGDSKHTGLSQLLVDLATPGVTVRPITTIDGSAHFAEVIFDDVAVPADMMLGVAGQGWKQINSELAYERGGPDRWLSSFRVYAALARASRRDAAVEVGRMTAWYRALHELSYGIASAVAAGAEPAVEAALVKDLGTAFEQRVVETARRFTGVAGPELAAAVSDLMLIAPGFTIRGGSTQVLRTIVARRFAQ
ncbi:MAG TPA: acyl-CoA dehydrogenase family protein [Mycobacterium sp.]